jgi:hypothetical protein
MLAEYNMNIERHTVWLREYCHKTINYSHTKNENIMGICHLLWMLILAKEMK